MVFVLGKLQANIGEISSPTYQGVRRAAMVVASKVRCILRERKNKNEWCEIQVF